MSLRGTGCGTPSKHVLKKGGDVTGYTVCPQHMKLHSGEAPDWTMFYLVLWGYIPVCVVEVKPYTHLKTNSTRHLAYEQLVNRLVDIIDDELCQVSQITKVYGIQVMGPRFMVMCHVTQDHIQQCRRATLPGRRT
jgi:hypothetical protein